MTTVFVLASDVGPSGPARQLALVLPALSRERFRIEVVAIGTLGPAAAALRAGRIEVRHLPLRAPFDPRGWRELRRAVSAARPDVLHAVGPEAVRASYLVRTGNSGPKLIVSGASHAGFGGLGWLTARRTRQADRVLCYSNAEAERYRRQGVAEDRLVRVPLAVLSPPSADGREFRRSIQVPETARLVLAAGRLDRVAGLKDAVWAFDILKYESPEFHLVFVGDGPERNKIEAFNQALAFDDYRTRFAGERADLPALMTQVEAVWVLHERGGLNIALEAQAAGRPVLGWRTPDLEEVIEDGTSGLLLPRHDRIGLAAKTRAVLEDRALGERLGEAGRAAAEKCDVEAAAARMGRVYEEVGSSGAR